MLGFGTFKRKFAVLTEENSILVITARIEGGKKPYVSITGDEFHIISKDDLIQRWKDRLDEGEDWKMAVEGDYTTDSMEDWNEEFLENEEYLEYGDSKYLFDYNGKEYYSDWISAGQNYERDETKEYQKLFNLHLNHNFVDLMKARFIIRYKLPDYDIDKEIEKLGKQIIDEE